MSDTELQTNPVADLPDAPADDAAPVRAELSPQQVLELLRAGIK